MQWIANGLEKPLENFPLLLWLVFGSSCSACPLGALLSRGQAEPSFPLPPLASLLPLTTIALAVEGGWSPSAQSGLSQTTWLQQGRQKPLVPSCCAGACFLSKPSCSFSSWFTGRLAFPPGCLLQLVSISASCHTLLFIPFCTWKTIFSVGLTIFQVLLPLPEWLPWQHVMETFSGQ